MAKKKATSKKTTKKKTVKKKTTKKKKKSSSTSKLDKIAKTHYFVRSDGRDITSLIDLAQQLDQMADDVFYHHVNEMRNDFAQWIHDVFKQKDLAKELRNVKNKHHTTYVVMKHIVKKL